MNLSVKNLLVMLVCSVTLLAAGCKKSSSTYYKVKVNISGLIGGGLQLQNNSVDNLTVNANGVATFTTQLSNNQTYSVAILKQPGSPPQTCVLTNPAGTISSADVTVTLACNAIEFAYLVNQAGNSITPLVINETTGALAVNGANIPTGSVPLALALDPTGRYVYALNSADNTISSYLGNPANGLLVSAGAALGTGISGPQSVVVDASGKYVFVANSTAQTISGFAINPASGTLSSIGTPASNSCLSSPAGAVPPVGQVFCSLASVSSNGNNYLYVTNPTANSISEYVISAGTLTAPATIATGSTPAAIVTTPASAKLGPFAYVVNSADATVTSYAINAGSLVSTGTISTGGTNPLAMAVSPNGQYAYVVNNSSNTIAAFSIASNGTLLSLGAVVGTGNGPKSVSVEPKGGFAYVANFSDNTVSVYPINANGTLAAPTVQSLGNNALAIITSAN